MGNVVASSDHTFDCKMLNVAMMLCRFYDVLKFEADTILYGDQFKDKDIFSFKGTFRAILVGIQ